MTKHNPENERIKRRYFAYLKEARRYSESTVDQVAKAIARFEAHQKYRDFRSFHFEQAIAFKRHLVEQRAERSGKQLSKATLNSSLAHNKRFFQWLSGQPGFKSRMQYSDADYFNLSEKEVRIATAHRENVGPTIDQILHVLGKMPTEGDIAHRNRALVAFTLLTGARDSATASMKLKHVDLQNGCVAQDAREVDTKFSKTFTTFFFPVGESVFQILDAWVEHLRTRLMWGDNDPLFPATLIKVGSSGQFEIAGLDRAHWKTATPIRTIFRDSFKAAGLEYFNPHSFRNTLVRLGESVCRTPEEFKAWSQNLGHEKVLTTFMNYGQVETSRQKSILETVRAQPFSPKVQIEEIALLIAKELQAEVRKRVLDH